MSDTILFEAEERERFFTFKNIGVALLAGNAVLYSGNPESWILDTQLLSELLHSEAKRFAQGATDATQQEGSEDPTSNGEVLREG